jgi:alpha-1,2-mannosyltransferase
MIMESWGTAKLAYRAISIINPHVYVDTTGCAFTFPIAGYLGGCNIGTYVHYPTMSVDMLSLVRERRPSYNNVSNIASNALVSRLKLAYYVAFAICYGFVGGTSDLTMANSNWTRGHLQRLWKFAGRIRVVFPPVDTRSVRDFPIEGRERMVISIGQFRPEKDHALQLRSFARLLDMHGGAMRELGVTLVLIGSCRDEGDARRVDELQNLARELGVEDRVEFVLNMPYSVVKDYLRRASVGIHTMWNEHFGIGVVEMMSAGLVTIAHDSGGPKSDIILRPWDFGIDYASTASTCGGDNMPTGCLATTADEYAAIMYEILKRNGSLDETIRGVRMAGRKSAERFSDEEFLDSFKEAVLSSSLFETRDDASPLFRYAIFVVVIAILARYY